MGRRQPGTLDGGNELGRPRLHPVSAAGDGGGPCRGHAAQEHVMSRSPELTAALAAFQAAGQAAEQARARAYEARQAQQKAGRGKAAMLRDSSAGQAAELNDRLEGLQAKAVRERTAF